MYKISDIKVKNVDKPLNEIIGGFLSIPKDFIFNAKIIKQSIDARKKDNIHYVLSVVFECKKELKIEDKVEDYSEPILRIENLPINKVFSEKPIMVVGSGPSGLFCALTLLTFGQKVVLVERGEKLEDRNLSIDRLNKFGILNEESNIQYGEGGAGTYSDGKLNSGIKSPYINLILNEFVEFGAPDDILYLSKPHIGTDYLQLVVKKIREKIYLLGGSILYNTKLTDVKIENNKITKAILFDKTTFSYDIEGLVLATGHSSLETYEMLLGRGIRIEQKPFSLGVRIEHLQENINFAQYGTKDNSLPPADYKLATHLKNGRSVYSFCMCPGGDVVCSSSSKGIVTNGMSNYNRDGKNSNSALLVNVMPQDFNSEHPLGGYFFKDMYEKKAFNLTNSFTAPIVKVGDFLNDKISKEYGKVKPTYLPGVDFLNLKDCLPLFVYESLQLGIADLDRKLKGFNDRDALLTGIETRSSSPIRIPRDANFMCNIEGIYPIGEGCGYAGGIMSSANDGILMAINFLNRK